MASSSCSTRKLLRRVRIQQGKCVLRLHARLRDAKGDLELCPFGSHKEREIMEDLRKTEHGSLLMMP